MSRWIICNWDVYSVHSKDRHGTQCRVRRSVGSVVGGGDIQPVLTCGLLPTWFPLGSFSSVSAVTLFGQIAEFQKKRQMLNFIQDSLQPGGPHHGQHVTRAHGGAGDRQAWGRELDPSDSTWECSHEDVQRQGPNGGGGLCPDVLSGGSSCRKGRAERSFRAWGWAGLRHPAVSGRVVSRKGGILEKAVEFHTALCIRGWTVGSFRIADVTWVFLVESSGCHDWVGWSRKWMQV